MFLTLEPPVHGTEEEFQPEIKKTKTKTKLIPELPP